MLCVSIRERMWCTTVLRSIPSSFYLFKFKEGISLGVSSRQRIDLFFYETILSSALSERHKVLECVRVGCGYENEALQVAEPQRKGCECHRRMNDTLRCLLKVGFEIQARRSMYADRNRVPQLRQGFVVQAEVVQSDVAFEYQDPAVFQNLSGNLRWQECWETSYEPVCSTVSVCAQVSVISCDRATHPFLL